MIWDKETGTFHQEAWEYLLNILGPGWEKQDHQVIYRDDFGTWQASVRWDPKKHKIIKSGIGGGAFSVEFKTTGFHERISGYTTLEYCFEEITRLHNNHLNRLQEQYSQSEKMVTKKLRSKKKKKK